MKKLCLCCGDLLPVHNNVKNYNYCGKKRCQRMRRARWQRKKLARDADYEHCQHEARQKWKSANPDYMKRYRASHPEYRLRDNAQRRIRHNRAGSASNKTAHTENITSAVKMDPCLPQQPLQSGCYQLRLLTGDCAVNMDSYTVQLIVIQRVTAP